MLHEEALWYSLFVANCLFLKFFTMNIHSSQKLPFLSFCVGFTCVLHTNVNAQRLFLRDQMHRNFFDFFEICISFAPCDFSIIIKM